MCPFDAGRLCGCVVGGQYEIMTEAHPSFRRNANLLRSSHIYYASRTHTNTAHGPGNKNQRGCVDHNQFTYTLKTEGRGAVKLVAACVCWSELSFLCVPIEPKRAETMSKLCNIVVMLAVVVVFASIERFRIAQQICLNCLKWLSRKRAAAH